MMASLQDAQKLLKNECEMLWQELQNVQEKLTVTHNVETTSKDTALTDIYSKKEQLLVAQLQVMKDQEPKGPNSDKHTHTMLIREELEKSVDELQDTILLTKEQRKESELEVQQLEQQVSQHRQMLRVLEERIETTTAAVGAQNETQVLQKLQTDYVNVDKYHHQLMKKMSSFVNKHYPQPDGKMPLTGLLEELMNKCIESPYAPYVQVKEAWQPYVELLLRTGICIRHNDNDSLLKLTPFHL